MSFEMTIGTYPNNNVNLDDEIELIKIGLLYSDRVTLKSLKADLIYSFLEYAKKKALLDRLYAAKKICHLSKSDLEYEFSNLIAKYEPFTKQRLDNPKKVLLKRAMEVEFEKTWGVLNDVIYKDINKSDIASLDSQIELGKLEIERYDLKMDDMLAVDSYFESLKNTFTQSNNYPLLDEEIAKLVRLGVKEGKIHLTKGTTERIKHSKVSLTILEKLPSFEKASIDEIIDIRSELDKYITRFRSAVVDYTDLIQSDIYDEDLAYEIDKLILKEINPAIQDLDELCKGNSYLRELGYSLVNSRWVQLGAVTLVLGNLTDVFATTTNLVTSGLTAGEVTAGVRAGVELINQHKDWKERKSQIEKDNLFFYYQAGERLK